MRDDMLKVLTVSPRCKRVEAKGRRGEHTPRAYERATSWEPLSVGRGHSYRRVSTAPLARFLERSVGRPWDDVYSELRATLAASGGYHVRFLKRVLEGLVELHAVYLHGVPYRPDGRWPIVRYRTWGFYVCPTTGTLREGIHWALAHELEFPK